MPDASTIIRGRVQQGVVVFDQPVALPDGTEVTVSPVQNGDEPRAWADVFKDVIGKAPDLPEDFADNHDYYIPRGAQAMTECFADTFVFLALVNAKDLRHVAAVQKMQSLAVPLVTTAWVLTELADGLCARATRATFVTLEQQLQQNARVTIVPASQPLFERGLTRYRQRPDKDWSLTDCISFLVMEDRGIRDALTGDHHFEQAGFNAMLK